MSYEIRAMSLGEVLDTAFRLLRNHLVLLLGIGFILALPAQLFQAYLTRAQTAPTPQAGAALFGFVLFFVIISPIVSAAITHAIGEVYLGRTVTIGAAYKVGFQLFFRLVGTAILMTIFVAIGLLLLVIPGIYLLFAFMLTYQVIVFERVAGLTALKRSRELAKQNLLRILAIYVVTIVIMTVLGAAVGLVLAPIPVLGVLGNAVVQAVMSAYMPAAFVVLYFDIRCRKEAFDLEHLTQVVEGRPPAAVAAG
jgi:hypothetical protein